ncbi:MAG: glutamate synthase, partial [Pseudomonadota bacterium]
TQKPHLVSRLVIEKSAHRLKNFFEASTDLMKVMARACGHSKLSEFSAEDLTTFSREMSDLSGVAYAGVGR